MAVAEGACFNHIARESNDVKRLAKFYMEIFGFEEIETPKVYCDLAWLKLGSSIVLHIIQRHPNSRLPISPYSSTSTVADPKHLPTAHHTCFTVSNFDSCVRKLKERGIEVHLTTQPGSGIKQVFFFDPDGNGLECQDQVNNS